MQQLAERRGEKQHQVKRREPPTVHGRVPPHDLDAEAAVLAAVLLERSALDEVIEILKPEHFYSDAHGRIYEAAQELALAGTPIDIIHVAAWLRDRERLQQVGGAAYLAQLADATPAVAHVASHARVVFEKWRVRQLIATCQKVAAEGYGDFGEPQAFIDSAEQAIYELGHVQRMEGQSTALGDVLREVFQQLEAACERGDVLTGTPTGYERLDEMTSGMHGGELIIAAGRPGMGKSSLAHAIAINVAEPRKLPAGGVVQGRGVAIFSLEMPRDQFAVRMVCSEARVDLKRMRSGRLEPADFSRMAEAGRFLNQLPIKIDDTPAIDVLTLRAKLRRMQAEWNQAARQGQEPPQLGLVIIDYLQLMKGRGDNREQEIASVSRDLKALAKEFKVPVIALAQLNRSVETRSVKDKRPILSDLRESGQLEQDADVVIFIHRQEYYTPDDARWRNLAELIVAKQRNGPTGRVLVRFTAQCTRFDNLAPGEFPADLEDE